MVWKINANLLRQWCKDDFAIFHQQIPGLNYPNWISSERWKSTKFLGNNFPRSLRFKNLILIFYVKQTKFRLKFFNLGIEELKKLRKVVQFQRTVTLPNIVLGGKKDEEVEKCSVISFLCLCSATICHFLYSNSVR